MRHAQGDGDGMQSSTVSVENMSNLDGLGRGYKERVRPFFLESAKREVGSISAMSVTSKEVS